MEELRERGRAEGPQTSGRRRKKGCRLNGAAPAILQAAAGGEKAAWATIFQCPAWARGELGLQLGQDLINKIIRQLSDRMISRFMNDRIMMMMMMTLISYSTRDHNPGPQMRSLESRVLDTRISKSPILHPSGTRTIVEEV